jgi:hypothetical protein
MPDYYRPANQFRVLEQFDRREKRIHVDVEDRRGGVVDVVGCRLSTAPVLLAHALILAGATDRRGHDRSHTPRPKQKGWHAEACHPFVRRLDPTAASSYEAVDQ